MPVKHRLIRDRYTHCLICGEEMEKPNYQRKFCSKECYDKNARKRHQRSYQNNMERYKEYAKKQRQKNKKVRKEKHRIFIKKMKR